MERIVAGGRTLEYAFVPARRTDRPVLVFLHEGLGSARLWRDLPAAVAARTGLGALAYSRYGNGFSVVLGEARAPSYMHDEAETLRAILRALGIGRAIVVGHSDGASIALIFAAEYPDTAAGLVLEAPHVFVEDLSVASIAAIGSAYRTDGGAMRTRLARHHEDPDATFFGWNDVWLSPAFRAWNIEAHAARTRAPVLLVQGLDDEYGTLAQIDAIARRVRGPADRLILANCGHAPHRDRRGVVEAVVTSWVLALV